MIYLVPESAWDLAMFLTVVSVVLAVIVAIIQIGELADKL